MEYGRGQVLNGRVPGKQLGWKIGLMLLMGRYS